MCSRKSVEVAVAMMTLKCHQSQSYAKARITKVHYKSAIWKKNILSILLSGFLLLESSGTAAACASPKDTASGWARAEFVPAVGFCEHTDKYEMSSSCRECCGSLCQQLGVLLQGGY